jgi:hypothetical protein
MTETSWLTTLKDWGSILSGFIIVIGAIFAWWRWGREKPQAKRAQLTHQVFVAPVDEKNLVLHVALEIQNKGKVRIKLHAGTTEVKKISPADEEIRTVLENNTLAENQTEMAWPKLMDMERRYDYYATEEISFRINSNETDYLYCDFILPKSYKVIAIRSELYFSEKIKPKYPWVCTTFVNVADLLHEQTSEDSQKKSQY